MTAPGPAGRRGRLTARNQSSGTVLATRVEVADTRRARARGLLGRDRLEPGQALYIVPSRGVHTCGMRFPIDIAAIAANGVVVDVVRTMKPWRVRLPRKGVVGVLELAAGTLERSKTDIGHRLVLEPVREES